MRTLGSFASGTVFAASLILSPVVLFAQQTQQGKQPAEIAPRSAEGKTATQSNFNKDQIMTATVHQAWLLSGKDEANFFEIVEQLADISAQNRGVTLPDSEAEGRRMGDYIKKLAKSDTNQLLYAVVDKAVVMVTRPPVHTAGSKTSTPKS